MKFINLFLGVALTTFTPALSYSFLRGLAEEQSSVDQFDAVIDHEHDDVSDISGLFSEIEALKDEHQGERDLGKLDDRIAKNKAELEEIKQLIKAQKEVVAGFKTTCKPNDRASNRAHNRWKRSVKRCKKFQNGTSPYDAAVAKTQREFKAFGQKKTEYDEQLAEIKAQFDVAEAERKDAKKEGNKSEEKVHLATRQKLAKEFADAKADKKEAKALAKKARDDARADWKDAFKACKDDRQEFKTEWQTLKKTANKSQKKLKAAIKKLRNLKKRRSKFRMRIKKLNKKLKKRKRRRARRRRRKFEVKKELVAGQCVADHKCASVRGDPHITTFDNLKYDCQGDGEFVLAKTINSDTGFELQARFTDIGRSDRRVSITTALSITTGTEGEPDIDVYTKRDAEDEDTCDLFYFVDGNSTDFATAVDGVSFEDGKIDYIFFTGSGIMLSLYAKAGKFGCVINSKLCLPPSMVVEEDIVGLLGTPDGTKTNEWTTPSGAERNQENTGKAMGYAYCTQDWCVRSAEQSIFGYQEDKWEDYFNCNAQYYKNGQTAEAELEVPDECEECCKEVQDAVLYDNCVLECSSAEEGERMEQCVIDIEDAGELSDAEKKCKDPEIPGGDDRNGEACPTDTKTCSDGTTLTRVGPDCQFKQCPDDVDPTDATTERAFTRGDPHFKTYGGELYDFHGECDLVLMHNPDFKEGLGMDVHIRTKITDWWSSVESAAVKIGSETLEIQATEDSNQWLWINGKVNDAELEDGHWYRSEIAGFLVRYRQSNGKIGLTREAKIYVEGSKEAIELKSFKSFVRVDIAWKDSENYNGSTGLLGSHANNGERQGRDGVFIKDVNAFGQDWQVRADEPQLFHSYEGAIMPPKQCRMPDDSEAKQSLRARRLAEGMSHEEAEAACAHLTDKDEKEACVYDVLATQDKGLASAW